MGNVIDFGLMVLVILQIGLVVGSYHFWNAAKSELSRINKTELRIDAVNLLIDHVTRQLTSVEGVPKALTARMEKLEMELSSLQREHDKTSDKIKSLAAKYSAITRWSKKSDDESGPASQDDDSEQELIFPTAPGTAPIIPNTFGKMPGRRTVNG